MTVLAKLTPGNFFRFSSSHQVNALREELERFAMARPEARALVPCGAMRLRSMISASSWTCVGSASGIGDSGKRPRPPALTWW